MNFINWGFNGKFSRTFHSHINSKKKLNVPSEKGLEMKRCNNIDS